MRKSGRAGVLFGTAVMCMSLSLSSVYGEELQVQDKNTVDAGNAAELQTETELQAAADNGSVIENKSYDIVSPVIDRVVLPQAGQTLTSDDRLLAYIYAHDDDSGIEAVSVEIGAGEYTISLGAYYNEELGCYVIDEPLTNVNAHFIYIKSLTVSDRAGNRADLTTQDEETGSWLYQLPFQYEDAGYAVKELVLEQQGETLTEEDTVALSFSTEPQTEQETDAVFARFVSDNGRIYDMYVSFHEETGRYEGSESASAFGNGRWTLSAIGFSRRGELSEFSIENPENCWFCIEMTPEPEPDDTEPPVIQSIEMEKNGQSIQAGESVTIKVKASDNVGLDEEFAFLQMYADAENIMGSTLGVILYYDSESGMFTGEFETADDTYPCEWYIGEVMIYDLSGNCTSVTDYRPDFEAYHPYYVNVINQDTFVSDPYEATVTFVVRNDRGGRQVVAEVTKDQLKKRSTFKEAGIQIPEAVYATSGIEQTGWVDEYGNIVDENTQVPPRDNAHMTVYASYASTPVIFVLDYYTQDGDVGHFRYTYGMPNGSTYGDVKKYLSTVPLPDDAASELAFSGWQLEGVDDDAEVGIYDYLYVSADYKENVYHLSFEYLNKDGQWTEENQLYTFEEGTTYGEMFAYAYAYVPSDCSSDIEFMGFVAAEDSNVSDYNPNEIIPADHPLGDTCSFTADYGDKVVVCLQFSYYDVSGYYITDQRTAIAEKGSSYADILSRYKPETIDSYPGLQFEGWTMDGEEGNVVYSGESLSFEAQYANCLLRFIIDERLADGIREDLDFDYISCMVAEYGETVTLPAKFDGYSEITWLNDMWPEDGVWKVDGDVTFFGYGVKTDTPDEPVTPPDSQEPSEDPGTDITVTTPVPGSQSGEKTGSAADLENSVSARAADTGDETQITAAAAALVGSAAVLCIIAAIKKFIRSGGR